MGWWCTQCNCEHENTACPRQFESVSSPMQDTGTVFPEPAIDERIDELEANNKALQDVANAQLEEIAELEACLREDLSVFEAMSDAYEDDRQRIRAVLPAEQASTRKSAKGVSDE